MPLQLFQLADREKIKVEYFDFTSPVMGLYWVAGDMPPLVGLDKSLVNNTPLLRTVFAEELGHHFTSAGTCIPKEFYNYTNRLTISKAEYKALKWAANYLIPENDFLDALRDGLYEPWEFAEFFNVTEDLVKFRLQLFTAN